MKPYIYLAAGLALAAAPAFAQGTTNAKPNAQDQAFAKKAAQVNLAEIACGKYAADHADTVAVREYGRWLQTDHSFAQGVLEGVAKQDDVQLPAAPDHTQTEMLDHLKSLHGRAFDERFASDMVKGHEQAIGDYQKEAQDGQGQFKTLAASFLPILQAHLNEAQDLQRALQGKATLALANPGATSETKGMAGSKGMAGAGQATSGAIGSAPTTGTGTPAAKP